MPTYQYVCNDCGESLEAVQKFSDDALTVCPSCEGRLRKVYSAVGVVFKGSGFYRNDSRSTGSSTAPAAPAKTDAAAPAASTSSSDSSSSGRAAPALVGSLEHPRAEQPPPRRRSRATPRSPEPCPQVAVLLHSPAPGRPTARPPS